MFHNVLMTSLTPLRDTNETSQCWQNRPFAGIWPEQYKEYKQKEIQRPIRKKRRNRTCFTTSQVLDLEDLYAQNKYLSAGQKEQLAIKMNLSSNSIKVWFQNRRMKEKKANDTSSSGGDSSSEITSSEVSPESTYRNSSPEEYTPNSYNYNGTADVVVNQHPIANNEAYADAQPPEPTYRNSSPEEYSPNSYNYNGTADVVVNQHPIANNEAYADAQPPSYQLPIENVPQQPNPVVLDTPTIPVNQQFTGDLFNVYPTSYYPLDYYYYSNAYYSNVVSSNSDFDWPTNNYELNHL